MAHTKKVIRPSGAIRFKAVWHVDGKERSKNFDRERDAKLHVAQMHAQTTGDGIGDPDRIACSALFDKWLTGRVERGELSPATYPSELAHLRRFKPLIGHIEVAKLSPGEVEDALTALMRRGGKNGRPLKASTVTVARAILHNCMESARKRKLRADNPVKDAASPKQPVKREPRPWTLDEAQRLIGAADAEGCLAEVMVLCGSGARRAEMLGLRWSRVYEARLKLKFDATVVPGMEGNAVFRETTKTKSANREIGIPRVVMDELMRHKVRQAEYILKWGREYERNDLVFPETDGRPMRPQNMSNILSRLMRIASIPKGKQPAHAWRHFHLSNLLRQTGDIVTASYRAGHSQVSTTLNFYGATDEETDRQAADVFGTFMGTLKAPK